MRDVFGEILDFFNNIPVIALFLNILYIANAISRNV